MAPELFTTLDVTADVDCSSYPFPGASQFDPGAVADIGTPLGGTPFAAMFLAYCAHTAGCSSMQYSSSTKFVPAGSNFVLEEYCIDEQPAVWAQYAKNMAANGVPPSGVPISATAPGSNWEAPGNGYDEQSTSAVTSNVVNNSGAIGAVQVNYANDSGFTGSNPAKGVAAVENASGKFTLPTPVDVASALAYATQLPNGTHQLNFN